jgi:hypothetical protein
MPWILVSTLIVITLPQLVVVEGTETQLVPMTATVQRLVPTLDLLVAYLTRPMLALITQTLQTRPTLASTVISTIVETDTVPIQVEHSALLAPTQLLALVPPRIPLVHTTAISQTSWTLAWTVTVTTARLLEETGLMRKQHFYSAIPDASKMTPSQFASHAGDPQVLHDDKNHDRIRRNSIATHQETLSGI